MFFASDEDHRYKTLSTTLALVEYVMQQRMAMVLTEAGSELCELAAEEADITPEQAGKAYRIMVEAQRVFL